MSATRPSVYLLHGDDEFALAQEIAKMRELLGDPTTADMNTTHLDGRSLDLDELVRAVRAMPFLADRRLVILSDPLAGMKSPKTRERFKKELASVPESTALVLLFTKPLQSERDKKANKLHWLQKWAGEQAEGVFMREYSIPRGPQMARWIQSQAKDLNGDFSREAADQLAVLAGGNPRVAKQEIEKLLAYVNYQRTVEIDDVQRLTPDSTQLEDFALVNALRDGNQRVALATLQKMLETDEPLQIFGSITYQFRLLLLARSAIADGHHEQGVVEQLSSHLKIHPYPARLAAQQARQFSLAALENIYRSLLNLDEAIKTGQMEGDVALDILVTSLTAG